MPCLWKYCNNIYILQYSNYPFLMLKKSRHSVCEIVLNYMIVQKKYHKSKKKKKTIYTGLNMAGFRPWPRGIGNHSHADICNYIFLNGNSTLCLSFLPDGNKSAYPYDPVNHANCVELEFLISESCLEFSVVNM